MTALAETRQLSLHPMAIFTFIKAQAGSLGKALSEAVMNSIDAFAQNIDITITSTGFVIEDDGQGFRNREEIAAWFETMGFPHDDGNHRTYGKFGMGRAQMWAFASTDWYSNEFVMRVDVQKTGLDYALEEVGDRVSGTRIEAKFYKPLTFAEVESVKQEIVSLVRYAPALISLNELAISKDPSTEEWDKETKEAWMTVDSKKKGNLTVYNGGILVASFPYFRFNCSGTVVTKPEYTLSLNLARNDILVSDCKVWPLIAKHFPKKEEPTRSAPERLTDEELEAVGREVVAGVKTLQEAMNTTPHLVTSVIGRSLSWGDLVNSYRSEVVLFVPKGDKLGKHLSKLRHATVVASETLEHFGLTTPAELKALARKSLTKPIKSDRYSEDHRVRSLQSLDDAVWTDDADGTFPDIAAGKVLFATSDLDDAEKAARQPWTRAWGAFINDTFRSFEDEMLRSKYLKIRSISVGDSPKCASWISDGNTFVLRKKDLVHAMSRPMPELTRYVNERLLELFQDVMGDADKGAALFVKVMTGTPALGKFLLSIIQGHISECTSRDLPIPRTRLAELEELGTE